MTAEREFAQLAVVAVCEPVKRSYQMNKQGESQLVVRKFPDIPPAQLFLSSEGTGEETQALRVAVGMNSMAGFIRVPAGEKISLRLSPAAQSGEAYIQLDPLDANGSYLVLLQPKSPTAVVSWKSSSYQLVKLPRVDRTASQRQFWIFNAAPTPMPIGFGSQSQLVPAGQLVSCPYRNTRPLRSLYLVRDGKKSNQRIAKLEPQLKLCYVLTARSDGSFHWLELVLP
ncbi:hypothetical protein [Persicirhabdus sediminis]|nr:hypothetical protein [Persicirhabdus sediminis]